MRLSRRAALWARRPLRPETVSGAALDARVRSDSDCWWRHRRPGARPGPGEESGDGSIVLEQQASFSTAGAGIQLGPNGVHVLQRLGLAEMLRPMAWAFPKRWLCMTALPAEHWPSCRWGAGLLRGTVLPTGWRTEAICTRRWQGPFLPNHRSLCAQDLRLQPSRSTAKGVRGDELGGRISRRRGPRRRGRAVVERAPRHVCPRMSPKPVGATATRTVIPVAAAGRLALPAVGLWLSPGVNVVHYPVRGGSEIAAVVIAKEAWRGNGVGRRGGSGGALGAS